MDIQVAAACLNGYGFDVIVQSGDGIFCQKGQIHRQQAGDDDFSGGEDRADLDYYLTDGVDKSISLSKDVVGPDHDQYCSRHRNPASDFRQGVKQILGCRTWYGTVIHLAERYAELPVIVGNE